MANISLKSLIAEAGDFQARSKETGKLVHFKSKDAYQAALKAGSHEDPKAKKGDSPKAGKSNDMFGGDYAKDRGGEAPKADPMATVNSLSRRAGMMPKAIAGWADENGVNLSKVSDAINSGELNVFDFMTAVSGLPGNKYSKDIIAKYPQSSGSKYSQSVKQDTSVDGQDDEELYDALSDMGYDFGKFGSKNFDEEGFADAAMSLGYRYDDKNKVWNHRDTDEKGEPTEEPTSKPKEARKGNPTVNKEAKKTAEEFGVTPQKLGNEGYKKAMYQAAVEALTDANFHDEARELVSKIEGKPEWAKRVNYPSMDDPKYKEKMADIRTNGVDSSEYWGGEDGTHEFARKVAASSGWNGVEAADGIAFTLRMNGFHKEADVIQSVFDNKPYMRESSTKLTSMMKK